MKKQCFENQNEIFTYLQNGGMIRKTGWASNLFVRLNSGGEIINETNRAGLSDFDEPEDWEVYQVKTSEIYIPEGSRMAYAYRDTDDGEIRWFDNTKPIGDSDERVLFIMDRVPAFDLNLNND